MQGRGHIQALIPNVRSYHVENSKPKAEVYLPPAIAKQKKKVSRPDFYVLPASNHNGVGCLREE